MGRLSAGSYLVIVPEGLERDEELAGTAAAAPEPLCLEGYQGHFFYLASDHAGKIAFRDQTGDALIMDSSGPRFQFAGKRLHDASDTLGPLFGGSPPRIRIGDGNWREVRTIVIGVEGIGQGQWRRSFSPNPALAEQDLPAEIVGRKAGWYFVRFYDSQNELIDSLDFRFAVGLRGITIQPSDPCPSAEGHEAATVEFQHDADWRVIKLSATLQDVGIGHLGETTILTIPPSPECDRTQWLLGPESGPNVEVTILIERLWWAVGEENSLPSEWHDEQIPISREDLAATSRRAFWLHVPKKRWTDYVRMGFCLSTARPYEVPVTENTVIIPLRDFGDAPEMGRIGEFPLFLWVSHKGQIFEASPCKLLVKACCRFDDLSTTKEEDMLQHVRAGHLGQFTRQLMYEELRDRIPNLPAAIYRCGYCPSYVRADNRSYPTEAIIRHIEHACEDARREGSVAQIRFRVVTDTEEIRENVIANLPRFHKCKLCDYEFKNFDETSVLRHLTERHRSKLFDLR